MVVTRRRLQQEKTVVCAGDENALAPGAGKEQPAPKRKALGTIDANQQASAEEKPKVTKPGMLTRRAAAAAAGHRLAAGPQGRNGRSPRPLHQPKPSAPIAPLRHQQKAAAAAPSAVAVSEPVARRTRAKRAAGAVQPGAAMVDAGAAAAAGMPAAKELNCPHNIDAGDASNPLAASGYVQYICDYLKRMEPAYRIDPDYIRCQPDINPKMRAILVDWLIDVSLKFKLAPETLYLATSYLDRFLQKRAVQRSSLQLVGIAALHIASKYEEIMLSDLRFNLTVPTPYPFLVRFLKAADAQQDVLLTNYAQYLCELSLTEVGGLKYPPSLLASAAIYTARVALTRLPKWPEGCMFHSGYSEEQLNDCAVFLAHLFHSAPSAMLTAAFKKYSDGTSSSIRVTRWIKRATGSCIVARREASSLEQERSQQRREPQQFVSPAEAAVARAQAWLEAMRAEVLSLPDKAGRFADSVLRPLTHNEGSSAEGTSYTHGGVVAEKSRVERLEQFARAARQQATGSGGGSPRLPAAHVASGGAGSGVSGSGGGLPVLGGFASLMQLGLPPLGPEAGHSAVASVGLDGDCPQEIRQAVTDEHLLQFGAALGEEAAMMASSELGLPAPWGQEPSLFGSEEGAAGAGAAGEEWEQIVDRSQPGLRYSAWRRPLRRGLYVYRSSAVIEGVSPGELRAFHLDDVGRSTWDDTVMEIQRVKPPSAAHHPPHNSECSLHRFRCRFPMPMAPRVYNYARRVWHRPADGGCYAICRTTQLPDTVGRGGGGGGGFGWPAREVEVGDYVSSVVIRATEGGAELATVYFEDSAVQPGLAKMAVPNGLWPFIVKYEQGLRASVKGQQQQRLEELRQEPPTAQQRPTNGQQPVVAELEQGQREGFQWPFQPQRQRLQQQQVEKQQLRQELQTQGPLQPGAEPRQASPGFQLPFSSPQREPSQQQQHELQQPDGMPPRPELGFQWPFQQNRHGREQPPQGVDALQPGQEQPREFQWPFQRPRQQAQHAQRRLQHGPLHRHPQPGQEQQGQRQGFQWPPLHREQPSDFPQEDCGEQQGHGHPEGSTEKRQWPFQQQRHHEQHEKSGKAAAVRWPWQQREKHQQQSQQALQQVEKQPEPQWPLQQRLERPAPQHGSAAQQPLQHGSERPGQGQEPQWPFQLLQQHKQDEVQQRKPEQQQQQQLDAVARRPWWPVFGPIPPPKPE
ncbi:hypothetical protein N2152v2_003577 [Parachlorella kessleri]